MVTRPLIVTTFKSMTEKLADVWAWRDYPVLLAIVEKVDRGDWVSMHDLALTTGLSPDDCFRAVLALERQGLVVDPSVSSGPDVAVGQVSGDAYRLTGLHPDPADAVSSLVHVLDQAATNSSDPAEKSKLKAAAGAIGELAVNGQVLVPAGGQVEVPVLRSGLVSS